jgi:phenylalanyl-tRNA synthetase beta chain
MTSASCRAGTCVFCASFETSEAMKFSYQWIRELVPGLTTPPPELMRLITLKTAECEGLEEFGASLARASVARVVSVEPMPDGHNQKTVVETARYGRKTVVCGAPNCRVGVITAYLPVGKAVIHGVESDGMLASGKELGINRDHSGIVELNQALTLTPDHVIEVDNKSLTHRPDLWGHHGMAREVAAITGAALLDPANLALLPSGKPGIKIEIQDFTLCPRYSVLVFDNVTVQPSPLWLQYRLEAIGLNSINNVVDVTNLILAELPQPMHAFDAGKLVGDTIFVRPAHNGERITALNDQAYELSPANLVVADGQGAIAIAGVIGGQDSAIGDTTRRIVLESANFNATSVRKTSSQLKLRTDASMRFEKALDPANTLRGLARAIELLQEVSPGIRLLGGVVDQARLFSPGPIEVSVAWLADKLGRAVTEEQVTRILESLGFSIQQLTQDVLLVTVPSWRSTKDVTGKEDLLEEVGRMIGYDSVTPAAPLVKTTVPPSNPERAYHRRLRLLAVDQGYTEVSNYSFISEEMARRFGFDPKAHVLVKNPIASDQALMRLSLLPGVWKNILENSKHLASFRFFEIGREIHARTQGLPEEVPHLVAVVFHRDGDGAAGLFELKRLAECVLPGCETAATQPRAFEHPERAALLQADGQIFGRLFELHPSLGVEGRAAILDLDVLAAFRLQQHDLRYQSLWRFPTSAFDLSVLCGLREPVGTIQRRLREAGGGDVQAIDFVREYIGAPFPSDRKSVSFRLTAGASDRTLSSEEVGTIRTRIIESLRAHGYELRV